MENLHRVTGVLVVEDDVLVAMTLESLLQELGCDEVHLAYDLATAGALIERQPLGLAILDVNIGSHLVFPVAEALAVRRVPIVFSTGLASDAFPPQWASHPILPKPFSRALLLTVLDATGIGAAAGSSGGPGGDVGRA